MADTRRMSRGAGHSYVLDGEPVDGVTKILGDGIPKPALIEAAARETANYAVNHWDELALEGVAQRVRKIEKGRFEAWNKATTRGTTVHRFAAQLLAGIAVDVPDAYTPHVDQCLRFLDAWHIRERAVEATVIYRGAHRSLSYMGAVDLIGDAYDGQTWLLDWKTGAGGIWPETALQLAAYAHAQTMLEGEVEVPLPRIDRAAAVWLRADGFDVVPLDISDATFRIFQYVQQVAAYRNRDRTDFVGDALPPVDLEAAS
jgi:hypothetical protein